MIECPCCGALTKLKEKELPADVCVFAETRTKYDVKMIIIGLKTTQIKKKTKSKIKKMKVKCNRFNKYYLNLMKTTLKNEAEQHLLFFMKERNYTNLMGVFFKDERNIMNDH